MKDGKQQLSYTSGTNYHMANGNYGMIFSRGFLDGISLDQFETCERTNGGYGDFMLGDCIHHWGYLPTNPSDVAGEGKFSRCKFGRFTLEKATAAMREVIDRGVCDVEWKELLMKS